MYRIQLNRWEDIMKTKFLFILVLNFLTVTHLNASAEEFIEMQQIKAPSLRSLVTPKQLPVLNVIKSPRIIPVLKGELDRLDSSMRSDEVLKSLPYHRSFNRSYFVIDGDFNTDVTVFKDSMYVVSSSVTAKSRNDNFLQQGFEIRNQSHVIKFSFIMAAVPVDEENLISIRSFLSSDEESNGIILKALFPGQPELKVKLCKHKEIIPEEIPIALQQKIMPKVFLSEIAKTEDSSCLRLGFSLLLLDEDDDNKGGFFKNFNLLVEIVK